MKIVTGLRPRIRESVRFSRGARRRTKVVEFADPARTRVHVLQCEPGVEPKISPRMGFSCILPDEHEGERNAAHWTYELTHRHAPDDAVITEERDDYRSLTTRTASWYEVTL